MKITGELHLRRMLAVLMTLVMLMTAFTVPALALDDWNQMTIYVNWDGAPAPVQAYAVPGSQEQAYWVTVDGAALSSGITVSATHPSHPNYTFDPAPDAVMPVQNASSADGFSALTLTAYVDGAVADTFKLYVSTNPIPPVSVSVRYVDQQSGQTLNETSVSVTPYEPGVTVSPDPSLVPSGYQLAEGQGSQTVSADANGANVSAVVFYCVQAAQPANVTIRYIDTSTGATLSETTNEYQPGAYTIWAETGSYPTYAIEPVSVDINVDGQPVTVEFRCTPQAQPANVTIRYIDMSTGATLSETTNEYQPGAYTIWAETGSYPTYAIEPASVDINVDGQPVTVEFRCTPQAQPANVTIRYIDTSTGATLSETTNEYQPGAYTIWAETGSYPTYAIEPASVDINVDGQPVTVEFRCTPQAQPANVTIRYIDTSTGATLSETTNEYQPGAYTIWAETASYPTYAIEPASVDINVDGQPVTVEFFCTPPQPTDAPTDVPTDAPTEVPTEAPTEAPVETEVPAPVMVAVTVRYVRTDNNEVVAETSTQMVDGESQRFEPVAAAYPDFEITPEYVDFVAIADAANVVEFYLTPIQQETEAPVETETPAPEPITVDVTVIYQSEDGLQVFEQQVVSCTQGQSNPVMANSASIPAGYTLIGESAYNVTVDEYGVASPNPVVFNYAAPLPVDRNVDVVYRTDAGLTVAQDAVYCAVGDNTVTPDASKIPADYVLVDTAPVTVTLYQDGTASHDPIVFRVMERPVETPIPQGDMIQRWGTINDVQVALRTAMNDSKDTVKTRLEKGTPIYVLREELDAKGNSWMRVLVDGQQYFVMAKFVDVMSGYDSDQYMKQLVNTANNTPVPPMTPEQLGDQVEEPTEVPPTEVPPTEVPATEVPATEVPATEVPATEVPATEVPATEVPATEVPVTEAPATDVPATDVPTTNPPTATPTPAPYFGYALTTQQVALRTSISKDDGSIIQTLAANTLVRVNQPGYDTDGTPWSVVTTLDNISGMLPDSSLRRITDEEAKYYLDLWAEAHATATPTVTPTFTPEPAQVQGYAVAIGDGVPYRVMPSSLSVILGELMRDEVVYVAGQQYADGVTWHVAQYGGQWVFVQADLLRMMTREEELAYLTQEQMTPEPTLAIDTPTYNPEGLSSYGYVNADTVNFRTGAGTDKSRNSKYPTLKKFAFCLVLGTQKIGNTTWYNVNYNGETGYVSGDYFKQMTITELENFITSQEYQQGLTNNNAQDPMAGTGTSGIPSYEEQKRQEWAGSGYVPSFEPFEPFETPGPLESSSVSPSVVPSEEPTTSFEPLPTVEPIDQPTEKSSGSALVWVIVILLLLAAAGGVYVYLRIRDNKRKMAQRAAQKRAQAARGESRPYARNNGATPAQPRTGTYPNQNAGQQARRPYSSTTGQGTQQAAKPPVSGSGESTAKPSTSPYSGTGDRPTYPTQSAQTGTTGTTGSTSTTGVTGMTGFERPESASQGQPNGSSYTASYRQGGDTSQRMGRRSAYRQTHHDYSASFRSDETPGTGTAPKGNDDFKPDDE